MNTKIRTLALCYCLIWPANLLCGFITSAWYNTGHFPPQSQVWSFSAKETVSAPGWNNLSIMRGDSYIGTNSFAFRINDGIEMLRRHTVGYCDKSIGCLDFVNPFPMILHSPYPAGQPAWVDYGNTFNESNCIAPEVFFGKMDFLMVPTRSNAQWCEMGLIKVYGDYITTHFKMVDHDDCWQVLAHE